MTHTTDKKSYRLTFLSAADIPASLGLQKDVLAALPNGDGHHLRYRGEAELLAHLSTRMNCTSSATGRAWFLRPNYQCDRPFRPSAREHFRRTALTYWWTAPR